MMMIPPESMQEGRLRKDGRKGLGHESVLSLPAFSMYRVLAKRALAVQERESQDQSSSDRRALRDVGSYIERIKR